MEQKSQTKFLPWPGFESRVSRLAVQHTGHHTTSRFVSFRPRVEMTTEAENAESLTACLWLDFAFGRARLHVMASV